MSRLVRTAEAVVVAALVSFAASEYAGAEDTAHETARPQITVTGEGTANVAPDFVRLRAGVVSDAKSAREAGDANGRAMNDVLAAIKSAGVADKDVQTQRYVIQPVYGGGSTSSSGAGPNGFRATNNVILTIRDPNKVADLIDRLVAAGANSFDSLEWGVSDRSKVLDAARADAVADARRKAELYARAAGVTLGRPLTIVETGANSAPPVVFMRAAGAPQTQVSPGETTLRVSITASFELQR